MTPDELFERLRFSSKLLTGAIMIVLGGVGFGAAVIVWGTAAMPEWARISAVAMGGYGAGMVLTEALRTGNELRNRRRARLLLRAGDHRRAAPVVLRLMCSSAHEEGASDVRTLRWQNTYAQVLAHLGRFAEAEDLLVAIVERDKVTSRLGAPRPLVVPLVRDYGARPVEIWWPALDVREVGRRIAQSRAVLLLYAGSVLGALAVGIAVLIGGTDAVPSWMRSLAVGVGVAVALVLVQVLQQVWVDRSLVRQVGKLLAIGDHEGAARNVGMIVDQHLARGAGTDPDLLRWSTTLTHLQLITGHDRDALDMLEIVRTEQQRRYGPAHPDVARTERVLAAAVAGAAAHLPVERWWR